ncbi:MAG: DHHA1 domain-containing protein [Nanoarchaeota archaeon]
MLNAKQIEEIREHLEKAQNPVFYYDNDADGLCSFLILRRALGRGKGVVIRSYPGLDKGYARRTEELGADYVFVLDKPELTREFVEEISKMGLPLVWIDHHDVKSEDYSKEFTNFFSYKGDKPVTYLCYSIMGKKEDLWLAVIGCVADHYLPDFAEEFAKKNKELWTKNVKEPFDVYYKTELGKVAQALNFGLKDSITNVVRMQKFLINCKIPQEVLEEVAGNIDFRKKYKDLKKKYESLIEKAQECISGRLLFFEYGGDTSISAEIANELSYRYRNLYVAVAFVKGGITNISLRGKNVKKILEKAFKRIEGTGGGHNDAVGARIKTEDLNKFKEELENEIGVSERT